MSHYEFLKSVSLAWLDPELYRKKLALEPTRGKGVLNDDSFSTTEYDRSTSITVASSTRASTAASLIKVRKRRTLDSLMKVLILEKEV